MSPFAFDLRLPAFELEAGARLAHHVVRGVCASPLATDRARILSVARPVDEGWLVAPAAVVRRSRHELDAIDPFPRPVALEGERDVPTVVVVHALTGDARAVGPEGFWAPMGEADGPLDTRNTRVLSFNLLGSCYGTSGPCDEAFPRREDDHGAPPPPSQKGDFSIPEGRLPATVTTLDQARSILAALDALGVRDVALLTGGSLGGMVALALAALAPERFRTVVPIAATHRASPWLQAWNHIARAAILRDPERGFEVARQLGMLSYRAEPGFDRTTAAPPARGGRLRPFHPLPVQTWLEHQGRKLRARFDVGAYLCLLGAMDHHDVGRVPDAFRALAKTSVLGVSIDTDQLYTPVQTERYLAEIAAHGGRTLADTIASDFGHDAFLIEWAALGRVLRRARSWENER